MVTQAAYGQEQATGAALRGGIALIEDHAEAWRALCEASADDIPFYRPEWIASYLKAFEPPQATVVLATAIRGGRMCAMLPLVDKRTRFCGLPVRMLQGAGNAHSCRFDLVLEAGPRGEQAIPEIWEVLKKQPGWDLIEFPLIPAAGAAEQLIRLARKEGYLTGLYESDRSAFITLTPQDTGEEIPHDSHFRQNLRRRMRKARAASEVRLKRITEPEASHLTRFYALERSGWKGQRHTGIADSEATRRFYDEVSRAAAKHGYFSLYLLEFGDKLAAGHLGLSYRGKYYCPKVAYDETLSRLGPGHLMILSILDDILPRGFSEFDFVGPWMEWKAEWARGGRQHYYGYIFRPGMLGRTLHWLQFQARPAAGSLMRRMDAWRQRLFPT